MNQFSVVMLIFGTTIGLSGIAPFPVEAQALAPVDRIERWYDRVPVSGGLRVGLMMEATTNDIGDSFVAWIPPDGSSVLCVQISSKDGRYEGTYRYELDRESSGWVRLAWISDHSEELLAYGPAELAVLARSAANCDSPDAPYILTSWAPANVGEAAKVLLNSDVPTSLVMVREGAVIEEAPCLDLQGVSRAFNLQCRLPAAWRAAEDAEIFVRVRERVGRTIRPRDFPLPIAG